MPVFNKGASATENSLITAGRSLFVENNYGYQDPFGPQSGAVTEPGFARIDVRRDGKGCRRVWTNRDVRGSSVVPKLSTKTGLIYTYTREPSSALDQPYFWTAIDARTGRPRGRSTPAAASASTTTTPASRSAAAAPPTSACSAAWSRSATVDHARVVEDDPEGRALPAGHSADAVAHTDPVVAVAAPVAGAAASGRSRTTRAAA